MGQIIKLKYLTKIFYKRINNQEGKVNLPQKYYRTLLFLPASLPILCSLVGEVQQGASYHPRQIYIYKKNLKKL